MASGTVAQQNDSGDLSAHRERSSSGETSSTLSQLDARARAFSILFLSPPPFACRRFVTCFPSARALSARTIIRRRAAQQPFHPIPHARRYAAR